MLLKFVPFLLALFAFALPDALLAQTFSEWFLAEGAQNAFFDEEILIANPNPVAVQIQVTLLPQVGTAPTLPPIPMLPTSRTTLRLRDVAGLPQGPVSARITCLNNLPIVVERGMYWLGRLAGHSAAGVTALAPKWHLGEGATGAFDDYVLVANPNDTPATVRFTFLPDPSTGFAPFTWTDQTVPARGRWTYRINDIPEVQTRFGPYGFSTVVESVNSGPPIAVERAMYWSGLRGGHDVVGVTAPQQTWHFGEGATSGNAALQFYTFFLLQNPSTQPATVTLTAFLDGVSTPVTHQVTLPPSSRKTVFANSPAQDIGFPGLPPGGTGFATTINSDVPIIAERAIYFGAPGQPWADGHATAGATSLASAWAFADGVEGPSAGDPAGLAYTTFFLLSNPNDSALPLRVTFLREDGTGIVVDETVAPRSRYNVLPSKYPELIGQRFATFIRSTNDADFVAERSVYWRSASGGHANLGIAWEGQPIATPPPPPTPRVTSVSPAQGRLSGGTTITINGENFTPGTTVTVGGVPATSVAFVTPQRITAVAPAAPGKRTGPVELKVTNAAGFGVGTFTYTLRVLAFGDSITRGTTSTAVCGVDGCVLFPGVVETPYPERLRELLGGDVQFSASQDVTNAGEPGECASAANCSGNAGESRLPSTLDQTYDIVVLLEGANDIGRPGLASSQQAQQARDGLSNMVTTTHARGRRIIIGRMTPLQDAIDTDQPRKDRPVYLELDGLIEQLAVNRGLPRILWGSISMSPDGLHPTQAGYHAMASQVLAKIREVYR